MTYREALEYLYSFQSRGIVPGVGHLHSFLERLGDPQKAYPSIIVAGTNGKGSTTMALSRILLNSGRRVGTYTSPHLHSFRERIRIDLEEIGPEALARLVAVLKRAMDEFDGELPDDRMTYFEIGTMLAFEAFRDAGVDAAVLEVGMGGRLDATNVSEPALSVITNIGSDHAEFLGESVLDRAREKFGIVRPGGLLVSAEKPGPVREHFRAEAAKIGARARFLGEDFKVQGLPFRGGERFGYRGPTLALERVETRLIGAHQIVNMALALAGIEVLIEQGWEISEESIRSAFRDVRWPGRLELLQPGGAPVLLDGAHNPEAAEVLVAALWSRFNYEKLFVVLGMLDTKRFHDYIRALAPALDRAEVILAAPDQPNPRPPRELAAAVEELASPAKISVGTGVPEALDRARELAGPGDLVLVTGSLYTVLEARERLGLARRGPDE